MDDTKTAYTSFEREVINALLANDDEACRSLRLQFESSNVTHRDHTGVGMYVHIQSDIPSHPDYDNQTFRLQDVEATIAGLQFGAGFILWVEKGKLSCLEVYTYQEELPKDITSYTIHRITGAGCHWRSLWAASAFDFQRVQKTLPPHRATSIEELWR